MKTQIPTEHSKGDREWLEGRTDGSTTLIWRGATTWVPLVRDALRDARVERRTQRVARRDSIESVCISLRRKVTHVRLFHGCRTDDVNQYYKNGIIRHGDDTVARARKLLGCAKGLNSTLLESAIHLTSRHLDRDRVFLALDDRQLLEFAGQYLIYGSESILAIAASITRLGGPQLRPLLKTIGKPTLFVCDVPLVLIGETNQRLIAESLYDAFRGYRGRLPKVAKVLDHTVIMRCDVPPSAIVSHDSPRSIVDWHDRGIAYSWQN